MVLRPLETERFPGTIVVVPSPAGVKALRRSGKQFLVRAWKSQLGACPDLQWSLLEDLPASGEDPQQRLRASREWPMILETGFTTEHSIELRVGVPYDLEIFDGHFPAIPIVPGVVQIGWAVRAARTHLGVSGFLCALEKIKFRRIVQPGDQLLLRLDYEPTGRLLRFRYSHDGTLASSGEVSFEVDDV
jgi:3-hydroxymyristoyl/3-hydroxydecanoyl-(acyl carrier protein) dehydratase